MNETSGWITGHGEQSEFNFSSNYYGGMGVNLKVLILGIKQNSERKCGKFTNVFENTHPRTKTKMCLKKMTQLWKLISQDMVMSESLS